MRYRQIRLDKDAIRESVFKTKYESFELSVLLFGLTYTSCFFMSTINEIFSDFIDKFMIFILMKYSYIVELVVSIYRSYETL